MVFDASLPTDPSIAMPVLVDEGLTIHCCGGCKAPSTLYFVT